MVPRVSLKSCDILGRSGGSLAGVCNGTVPGFSVPPLRHGLAEGCPRLITAPWISYIKMPRATFKEGRLGYRLMRT
jgi:hypothetical protein